MTGRLCPSVQCMVRVSQPILEKPVSGCRPSLLELAILTLKYTNIKKKLYTLFKNKCLKLVLRSACDVVRCGRLGG